MAKQDDKMPYLNPRFKVGLYDWDTFVGPRAGEPAPDFSVFDFEGNEVKLSDFRGKWVVIETGSATCSQYSKNIDRMAELRADFPEVEFLLIYVREAHPGERLHQHRSFADKQRAARLLPDRYNENRRILIDSLEGDMHRSYGAMPNVVYVVDPEGSVHYRSDWAHVDKLRTALSDRSKPHPEEHAKLKEISAQRDIWTAIRTMWTGGLLALWDFIAQTPALYRKHKLIDAYYDEHGRFKNKPEEDIAGGGKGATE